MERLIASNELMKILDINSRQLAGLRKSGLESTRIGQGKWMFLVEDVVSFFKSNIKSATSQ